MKTILWIKRFGICILMMAIGSGCSSVGNGSSVTESVPDSSVVNTTAAEAKPEMNILIIGDSNTEYGHITGQLEKLLEKDGKGYANGYRPLSEDFQCTGRNGVSVKNDASWKKYDMTENTSVSSASPCGIWVTSSAAGAVTTVKFKGTGADFYYLKQKDGGVFTIEASGCETVRVDTANDASSGQSSSAKISLRGLPDGTNTVKLVVQSGTVTLQGFVPKGDECTAGVVHNWGNAAANSRQYAAINGNIFETAVKELNPDYVVVLIGTNDWFPADEETNNLASLVEHVQEAAPDAAVMLTSTFDVDYADGRKWMAVYLKDAYPAVARRTGCAYWNMHDWFGGYDASRMLDGWHCNDQGGKTIAEEMLKQLKALDSDK